MRKWWIFFKQNKGDVLFLLLSALGIAVLLFFLGKDISFDFLHYHYYNAAALFEGQLGVDFFPVGLHTTLNPLADLIPYLLIVHTNTVVIFIFWCLVEIALYSGIFWLVKIVMAELGGATWPGNFARFLSYGLTLVMFCTATVLGELGTTMNDSHLSFFLILALGILLKWRKKWWSYLVAGLLFGVAIGLKLTFAPYGVALVVAILAASWNGKKSWREVFKKITLVILGQIIGFLLTAGWWLILMNANFGSPLFPYFNRWFQSEQAVTQWNYRDERYQSLHLSLGEKLFLPFLWLKDFSLVGEQFFFNLNITLAYVVVLVASGCWLLRRQTWRRSSQLPHFEKFASLFKFTLVFWLVSYCLWLGTFGIYRYLSTLEILSPLCILVIVAIFLKFQPSSKISARQETWRALILGFLISLVAVSLLPRFIPNWGRLPWNCGQYLQIEPITFPRPAATTVFVYREALGFILPFFPPETQLVRLQGTKQFPHDEVQLHDVLTQTPYWQEQLQKFVAAENDFYLLRLTLPWHLVTMREDLAALGLTWNDDACQPLAGPLFETEAYYPVELCPLTRLQATQN